MSTNTNGVESLIDLFTTELIKTLAQYADIETAVEIYRLADLAGSILADIKIKTKEVILAELDVTGEKSCRVGAARVELCQSTWLDEVEWRKAIKISPVCRDALLRAGQAEARLAKLQMEQSYRIKKQDVRITFK